MDTITEKALNQFKKESGWHTNPKTDLNEHLSIRDTNEDIVGHMYSDGSIKGTNSREKFQGLSGGLSWLLK